MKSKGRSGRPKTKVLTKEYQANRFFCYYDEYLQHQLDANISNLVKAGCISADLRKEFFQVPCPAKSVIDTQDDIGAWLEQEIRIFKESHPLPDSKDSQQWFFLAGMYYGADYIARWTLEGLFHMYFPFEATSMMKADLAEWEAARQSGKEYVFPTKLPSDMLRKLRKPTFSKKELTKFTKAVKEIEGLAYIEEVAESMNWSLKRLRTIFEKTAKISGITIEKSNGREFFRIN